MAVRGKFRRRVRLLGRIPFPFGRIRDCLEKKMKEIEIEEEKGIDRMDWIEKRELSVMTMDEYD